MFFVQRIERRRHTRPIAVAIRSRIRPANDHPDRAEQALSQLFAEGLLVSNAPGQGPELRERAATRRRTERWQSLLKVLSFRVASGDATAAIEFLHARLRWVFSPVVGLLAAAVVSYALWLLVGHGRELAQRLPSMAELTTPRYLAVWLATIAGVKMLHELGHAITCRHVGAHCHEMGVMLLALLPCLYTDVSDVWRLPSKWRRMAVSAAGMIVEVVLAAVALILWWHTEPGFLHTWLLGVAVICSVSTLVLNANPLLRYDGYYLLADWLEIPNLSGRSAGLGGERLQAWLLGQPQETDPLITPAQHRRLAIYAVASRGYSVVVLLAIFAMLLALARPWHLENLVLLLAAVTVGGMLLGPALGCWRLIRNPTHRYRLRPLRVALLGTALAGLAAAAWLWPIRHTVAGAAVFVPADGQAVYAVEPGQLEFSLPAGTQVQAGDTIARLADPAVEFSLAEFTGDVAEKRLHLAHLQTLRGLDPRFSVQLPTAAAELADAAAQLAQYQQRAERLQLRAPQAGTVIAPPPVEVPAAGDRLPTWSGSPLDPRNRHCWIESGTVLCTVGDPARLAALVAVDERDIAEVAIGDPVEILLGSAPVRIVTGRVAQVASRAVASEGATSDPQRVHMVEVQLTAADARHCWVRRERPRSRPAGRRSSNSPRNSFNANCGCRGEMFCWTRYGISKISPAMKPTSTIAAPARSGR